MKHCICKLHSFKQLWKGPYGPVLVIKMLVQCRASGAPAIRVGGVRHNSGKAKAKSRARKEVTHLELRQYRQQFLESRQNEHKLWVDSDVYDPLNLRQIRRKLRQGAMGPYCQT